MLLSVGLPILLVISFPLLLWALAKSPFKIIQPGLRFKVAAVGILALWLLAKIAFPHDITLWYWLAGFLFILACLIFAFMVWSVLCWGYTVCMLLSLHECNEIVDVDQWQKLHAGPNGIRQLTIDRVQVLVKFSLATLDGNQVVISKKGIYLAKVANCLINIFGIKL